MCSFLSLKQVRSWQGNRAYDVGVTKGERKIGKEDCCLARVSSGEKRVISREPSFVYSTGKTMWTSKLYVLIKMVRSYRYPGCLNKFVTGVLFCFLPPEHLRSSFTLSPDLTFAFHYAYVIRSTALSWVRLLERQEAAHFSLWSLKNQFFLN